MTIGRRLLRLARAELNSLLEQAAADDRAGGGGAASRERDTPDPLVDDPVDDPLARKFRDLEARLRAGKNAPHAAPRNPRRHAPAADNDIHRAYAALGLPVGTDLAAVRRAYRSLLRQHHPDKHAGAPAAARTAHTRTQDLNAAYRVLRRHLGA